MLVINYNTTARSNLRTCYTSWQRIDSAAAFASCGRCSTVGGFWIWQRIEKISWVDKISNVVLAELEEDRQMLKIIQQRQLYCVGYIFRHQSLLLVIRDGRIKGRPKGGRRRMQMLHMLAKDGYMAVKQEAEDCWR